MRQKRAESKRSLFVIVAILVVLGGLSYAVFQNIGKKKYENQGPGMLPTIQNGETVYAKTVKPTDINRKDIIVFEMPSIDNQRQIKRVVGLPGDKVTIANEQLTVTTPGGEVLKPYDDQKVFGTVDVTVGQNSFFVVGDNLSNSLDSRQYGAVPFDNVIGHVEL